MLTLFEAVVILYSCYLLRIHATIGVDVPSEVSVSEWNCLNSNYSVEFMICRAWHSYGAFDNVSVINLENAHTAGITYTDVYMFPVLE